MSTPHIEKNGGADWHPADIIAAIHKRGSTLRQLSHQNGLARSSLKKALRLPWLRAERVIADFIGVTPQQIWPSRYLPDGTRRPGLYAGDRQPGKTGAVV